MLSVEGLDAGYGENQVLFDMALTVVSGEVVSLLGRNGMGKTTTVKAIMGLVQARRGRIRFNGSDLTSEPPHRVARAGLGLVPEGRQVFPNLTVRENLVATARSAGGPEAARWTLARCFALFPRLRERQSSYGDQLSGGEQQMLAIGRALMTNPTLLILDEATEGLAPMIRREIWKVLGELKAAGLAILVIDKNLDALLQLANRHVIIEKGRPVWSGSSEELGRCPDIQERYLGL